MRYHRVCFKCMRLLQFYHYSVKHASSKVKSADRTCLDCFLKRHDLFNQRQLIRWFFGVNFRVCPGCHKLVRCPEDTCPMDTEIFHISRCIQPHVCKRGTEPVREVSGDLDPSISRMRATLDRLESRLPPRTLLAYRYSLSLDVEFEEAIALLEERAARDPEKRKGD
ncbi:hypothetical protein K440DRAFT_629722 [Wilcoxina mikolae CBS 423.85]|nr:hypothetical protein K440DRAFT_629722 [Wilcoxina mikolae CBS 423.85]